MNMNRIDKDDCAVYAIAFTTNISPDDARFYLWQVGRSTFDGTTDHQIRKALAKAGCKQRRHHTDAKTVRGFARSMQKGSFIVNTCDHVVAVVDGRICDKVTNSNLMRIEKVFRILKK